METLHITIALMLYCTINGFVAGNYFVDYAEVEQVWKRIVVFLLLIIAGTIVMAGLVIIATCVSLFHWMNNTFQLVYWLKNTFYPKGQLKFDEDGLRRLGKRLHTMQHKEKITFTNRIFIYTAKHIFKRHNYIYDPEKYKDLTIFD